MKFLWSKHKHRPDSVISIAPLLMKKVTGRKKKGPIYGRVEGHAGEGNGTPTPVLLPGKSHGQRILVGCSPWDCEESDTTERLHFHFHALEKEMATHSTVLAWRIPGTGEPGGLLSMWSHRVGHDWSDLAAAVEGRALIFSCENSKITTRCWKTIYRRMLDPIKKDTPCPRVKEKPERW